MAMSARLPFIAINNYHQADIIYFIYEHIEMKNCIHSRRRSRFQKLLITRPHYTLAQREKAELRHGWIYIY